MWFLCDTREHIFVFSCLVFVGVVIVDLYVVLYSFVHGYCRGCCCFCFHQKMFCVLWALWLTGDVVFVAVVVNVRVENVKMLLSWLLSSFCLYVFRIVLVIVVNIACCFFYLGFIMLLSIFCLWFPV